MRQVALSLVAKLMPVVLGTAGKQRLSILIYHRVLPEPDPMRPDEPTVDVFTRQMRLLRDHFNPLPLLEAVEKMQAGTLPERAVCVTFDDGYADNEMHALPILKSYGIPAAVFVSTGFLNGGRMWNDSVIETLRVVAGDTLDLRDLHLGSFDTTTTAARLAAVERIIGVIKHLHPNDRMALVKQIEARVNGLPNDLMMTDQQVRSLASAGVTIGAHTVSHPILASVPDDIARAEMFDSKCYLEDLIQRDVELFAYPNGKPGTDYTAVHPGMVESLGFKTAVSTHWGVSTNQSDRFQLPRFTPWDRQSAKFAIRLLANYRRIDSLAPDRH